MIVACILMVGYFWYNYAAVYGSATLNPVKVVKLTH